MRRLLLSLIIRTYKKVKHATNKTIQMVLVVNLGVKRDDVQPNHSRLPAAICAQRPVQTDH